MCLSTYIHTDTYIIGYFQALYITLHPSIAHSAKQPVARCFTIMQFKGRLFGAVVYVVVSVSLRLVFQKTGCNS